MNKKVFFVKLFVFIVLAIIMDITVTGILEKFYYSSRRGGAYVTNYIFDTNQSDIITFGSSTVSHAFVPQMFEDSLNMTCFNAGRDGMSVLFAYACFIKTLDRYVPKIIIIDVGEEDVGNSSFGSTAPSFFTPYYGTNPKFDSLLYHDKFDKVKLLSGIYRYNSKLSTIVIGQLSTTTDDTEFDRGYIKLSGNKEYVDVKTSYKETEIDKDKLILLENFIDLALENNCKVILTTAPIRVDHEFQYYSYIHDLAARKNVPYLNNYQNEIFLSDRPLFYDKEHLNHEGAIKYTNMFITYIKNNMIN